jgi:anti-anti-sigma factor
MSEGTISIGRTQSDGVEIVSLEGEVDLTNADLVREAVDATRSTTVVLHLTAVPFLDSMALSTVDGSQRSLASEQRSLVVVSPPASPAAWTLRVAGMDGDVVCESLDEALVAALARHTAA